MIRGNYSLAKEVRKNEQKSKLKIQSRQKHQSKLEQLSSTDPIRVFLQIEKLENITGPDQFQQKKLAKLRQDWSFIRKNKLHEEKVNSFLANRKKAQDAKEKEQRKLRGKDSVYFNPELNPLGKVPDINNVTYDCDCLPNIAKPSKVTQMYEQDELVLHYNIRPPKGSPPKFYKNVQNTQRRMKSIPPKATNSEDKTPPNATVSGAANLDSDSCLELNSDD